MIFKTVEEKRQAEDAMFPMEAFVEEQRRKHFRYAPEEEAEKAQDTWEICVRIFEHYLLVPVEEIDQFST